MHAFLDRLGRGAARFHWFVIAGWLVVVVGLFVLRSAFGGTYVNNYTVPGSESSAGLNILNKDFATAGGYSGSIVFHAKSGTVAEHADAVKSSMEAVGKLPDVVSAVDPLAQSSQGSASTPSPYISKDGSIVNAPVSFSVVPASLDKSYVDKLDAAVEPARAAGLQVEYGGGTGQIGKQADDGPSEAIGLALALLLLFLMFRSVVASGLPLVAAVFSVGGGLAVLGLLAAVKDFPVSAPTVATLLGLGVAIDYGLFLVSRHREQLDDGMGVVESAGRAESTSGAAILVAGGTVVIAILGLYVSGVPFVGALGLSSAIVVAVTVLAALTLIPALLGLAKFTVLNRKDRHHLAGGARARGRAGRRRRDRRTPRGGTRTPRRETRAECVRALGPQGERPALAVRHRRDAGAPHPRDPAAVDEPRPARRRHRPGRRLQPEGVRPGRHRVRSGRQRAADGRRTTAVLG